MYIGIIQLKCSKNRQNFEYRPMEVFFFLNENETNFINAIFNFSTSFGL